VFLEVIILLKNYKLEMDISRQLQVKQLHIRIIVEHIIHLLLQIVLTILELIQLDIDIQLLFGMEQHQVQETIVVFIL
jgi:hypothetical protein